MKESIKGLQVQGYEEVTTLELYIEDEYQKGKFNFAFWSSQRSAEFVRKPENHTVFQLGHKRYAYTDLTREKQYLYIEL